MEDIDWMDDLDEFDDTDAKSPSIALARRLARGRRKKVVPQGARPGAGVPPQMRGELARVYETMKRLEEKQEDQTKQLAMLQSRSAGLQSADLFGQSLSSAIANAAGPAADGDWWAVAAQAAPLLQNAQGAAASLKAKPISTLVFPAGALGLHAARRPRRVEIIVNDRRRNKNAALAAGATDVTVSLISPSGGTIRYEISNGPQFTAVTRNSPEYRQPIVIDVAAARYISARAYLLIRSSEQAELQIT